MYIYIYIYIYMYMSYNNIIIYHISCEPKGRLPRSAREPLCDGKSWALASGQGWPWQGRRAVALSREPKSQNSYSINSDNSYYIHSNNSYSINSNSLRSLQQNPLRVQIYQVLGPFLQISWFVLCIMLHVFQPVIYIYIYIYVYIDTYTYIYIYIICSIYSQHWLAL